MSGGGGGVRDPLATEPRVAQKQIWIVYYKARPKAGDPPLIIGTAESEEGALKMIELTQAHEASEGWGHDSIGCVAIDHQKNLVVYGADGPIPLT